MKLRDHSTVGGPDGTREIHVTLRDATFDPSNVFDHCWQIGRKKQTTLVSQGQAPSNNCIASQCSENPSLLRVHNAKTKGKKTFAKLGKRNEDNVLTFITLSSFRT